MKRLIACLILENDSFLTRSKVQALMTLLGVDVEKVYQDNATLTLEEALLAIPLSNMAESHMINLGITPTIERIDYIINDLLQGDEVTEKLMDTLNDMMMEAVRDRKIELEGLKNE